MDCQKICYIDAISNVRIEQHDQAYQKQIIERCEENGENYHDEQNKLFSKIMESLSEEGKDLFMCYCDNINDQIQGEDLFYYKAGLKDGIQLMKELFEY